MVYFFRPPYKSNNHSLYSFFNIIDANGYIAERQDLINSGAYKNIDVKYPDKQKELEDLLINSKEDDNPIIVIVELK